MALAQLASGTYGTELKSGLPVKANGLVRLRSVLSIISSGYLRNVQLHALFAAEADEVILSAFFNMFQNLTQLFAEEAGNDCGRRFVGTQSVGVCGAGDAGFQQSVVFVDCHQRIYYEGDERRFSSGSLPGPMEQDALCPYPTTSCCACRYR